MCESKALAGIGNVTGRGLLGGLGLLLGVSRSTIVSFDNHVTVLALNYHVTLSRSR